MTGHCWQCKAPLGEDGLYLKLKIVPKIQQLKKEIERLKKVGNGFIDTIYKKDMKINALKRSISDY